MRTYPIDWLDEALSYMSAQDEAKINKRIEVEIDKIHRLMAGDEPLTDAKRNRRDHMATTIKVMGGEVKQQYN